MTRSRALALDAVAGIALAVLGLLVGLFGARGPLDVVLDLGPNDGSYLTGFAPLYEIDGQGATRWSTHHAVVDLPLRVQGGPLELTYRFARVLPQTALVDVSMGGKLVDHFTCRGGVYQTRSVRLEALPDTPLVLEVRVDSHDRRNLGLRLDWVRFEVSGGGRVRFRGWAWWRPALFVVALFCLLRWSGFTTIQAGLLAAPWALAQAAWALKDPLGSAHVTARIAWPCLALGAGCAVLVRARSQGRWVVAIFVFGYLLKGVGLFAPSYFYPDVMNHRRYAMALAEAEGPLMERAERAQTALSRQRRVIGGKEYFFPYSPVFYLPYVWLPQDAELLEDAMRHVALALGAAEVVVVYWIASLVFGARTGGWAALLAALVPVTYSRLLLAQWPTVAGHFLDSLALGAALMLSERLRSLRRLGLLAGTTLASLLLYVSSLFNLGAFLGVLGLVDRRLSSRVLSVLGASAAVTVACLYGAFSATFVQEILPALWRGGGQQAATGGAGGSLWQALTRIPLFYGYGFPALALAGLVLCRRRSSGAHFRVLLAYGLGFAVLVAMRGLTGGLFKDLKEILFIAPWVAVLAGASLQSLHERGRRGRLAVALLVIGLAAFSLGRYREWFRAGQRAPTGLVPTQSSALSAPPTGLVESARLAENLAR